MKPNVDFIYEYSDLNLFQTRVKILTGEYANTILEYGGSILAQNGTSNVFTFTYELLHIPAKFANTKLKGDKKFEEFLAYLLVDVVDARKKDPKEEEKLIEAAHASGVQNSQIKIDPKFYSKVVVI